MNEHEIKDSILKDVFIKLRPVMMSMVYSYNLNVELNDLTHDMLFNTIQGNFDKYNINKSELIRLVDYCYAIQCKNVTEFIFTNSHSFTRQDLSVRDIILELGRNK